jgi:intermediate peptidase
VERVHSGGASSDTLVALDGVSSTICGVLDAMELARSVHPSVSFVEASDAAYNELAGRLAELNTDERLYQAVVGVLEDRSARESLSAEQLRFGQAMRSEFEHDGAHLSAVERGRLRQLHAAEAQLSQRFGSGRGGASQGPRAGGSGSGGGEGVWLPVDELAGLPANLMAALPRRGGRACVPAERSILTSALEQVQSESARRALHECREGVGAAQLPVLSELLSTRQQIAAAFGRPSYAEHAFSHDRMERSPAAVRASLGALSDRMGPRAMAELSALRETKQRLAPGTACGGVDGVHGWDLDFLMSRARSKACGTDETELAAYFELEAALGGLQLVLSQAFDLSLSPSAAADGELWHASVRKLLLSRRSSGAPLGVLYLDLFPRAGKSSQPALYTLRSGTHGGAAGGTATAAAATVGASTGNDGHGDEQQLLHRHLPAAALVINLPRPRGPGCDERSGAALLAPRLLETLYHEIGHAMHALLSRTETQHFSGTRVPLDFVEVPSLLMERFATEPRVLTHWARHHATDAPLPPPLAAFARDASQLFVGIETQRQCLHSLVDLELHGNQSAHGPGESARLVHALTAAHTVLPLEPSASAASWHGTFRHLAAYGTGYYTYLWARSMSQRVWRRCFDDEPLRAGAGARWCEHVLHHGGARDPREMLRALLVEDDVDESKACGAPRTTSTLTLTPDQRRAEDLSPEDRALMELVRI